MRTPAPPGARPRRRPRAHGHLGRRGLVLLLVAAFHALYGLGLRLAIPPKGPPNLTALTDLAPLHTWGWVWIGLAPVLVVFAPLRTGRDWPGFVGAVVLPLLWGLAYLASWAQGSYPLGWIGGALWMLVAALIFASGISVSRSDLPSPPQSSSHSSTDDQGDVDGQ